MGGGRNNCRKNSYTREEKACEDLFGNITYRDKNGRYIVRLPWKNAEYANKIEIGNSYLRAINALKRLEINFGKDKRLEIEYSKFMKEYMDLGHKSLSKANSQLNQITSSYHTMMYGKKQVPLRN